jgi:hypothetical protein
MKADMIIDKAELINLLKRIREIETKTPYRLTDIKGYGQWRFIDVTEGIFDWPKPNQGIGIDDDDDGC